MGALINIFKRLFGGIFGFIGGLIGGKKAIEGATVEGKVEVEKSVKAPKAKKPKKGKDGFYAVADESMMEELPAANAIVSTTDAVTTDAKSKKVKAVPANAVAKVAAPMSAEELIIAALKPNPAAVSAEAQAPTAGFATQYLVPTLTSGRRSPGPSLKGFKAMAKEIRG
jgi:hypothetical protein